MYPCVGKTRLQALLCYWTLSSHNSDVLPAAVSYKEGNVLTVVVDPATVTSEYELIIKEAEYIIVINAVIFVCL